MVRLKRSLKMNILKDVTIRFPFENFPEADVCIGILTKVIMLDSTDPRYDGFFYKNDIIIDNMEGDQLRLIVRGGKEFILRFGSPNDKNLFCRTAGHTEGLEAPCPSPASSTTPSPPSTTPFSPSSTPSPPSSAEFI